MYKYFVFLIYLLSGCKKFVEIPPPSNQLVKQTVFESDKTANSAMANIYYQMMNSGFSSGDNFSFTFTASISADEADNYSTVGTTNEADQFYKNLLLPTNSINEAFWNDLYKYIYKSNAILEGLALSNGVSDAFKKQLRGEAKFVRAFSYFYLLNLYGDVPLVTTTDYEVNQNILRVSSDSVYQQIITDLNEAKNELSIDYSFSNNERVRPNKSAASALLARVYLFKNDWVNAETEASFVIDGSTSYMLDSLPDVFSKSSTEAIWQLWSNTYPRDFFTFIVNVYPDNCALRDDFVSSFDPDDLRKTEWIGLNSGFSFSNKYHSTVQAAEYSTIIRLAEIYLIRAEARARQNNLSGPNSAASDINVIRKRAGLPDITSTSQDALLADILNERKHELFNEWGHRWLDLKRSGLIDSIMSIAKPSTWTSTAALYPIPQAQILTSRIKQNPGYE